MKTSMKALTLVLCAVLLVCASVMGTLAYLQDTSDVVTNTFTVGNVQITLDEAKVTEYGVKDGDTRVIENIYKLIPGHNYLKDPTIHVAKGSEQCYLFVKVVDGLAGIQADTTVAAQMDANGWMKLNGVENVWYYVGKDGSNGIVDAREAAKDVLVFDGFTIKKDANVAEYAGKTITVQAYAIQADGFDNAAAAWAAGFANAN